MRYNLTVFLCGLIFGIGLTISEMINPNKILNFLDFTGNWDPSLAFVMLGAVTVTLFGYRIILKKAHPKLSDRFYLPTKNKVDFNLVVGAAIFGIGWGLAGYCPGPAITALGLGIMDAVNFVIGMVLSVIIYNIFQFLSK